MLCDDILYENGQAGADSRAQKNTPRALSGAAHNGNAACHWRFGNRMIQKGRFQWKRP